MKSRSPKIHIGSGSVFEDLELPDAEELEIKARLILRISTLLVDSGKTQAQLGVELGLSQPKISALVNFRGEGFSVERLIDVLDRLRERVVISFVPKEAGRAAVSCRTLRPRFRDIERYRVALSLPVAVSPQPLQRMTL